MSQGTVGFRASLPFFSSISTPQHSSVEGLTNFGDNCTALKTCDLEVLRFIRMAKTAIGGDFTIILLRTFLY